MSDLITIDILQDDAQWDNVPFDLDAVTKQACNATYDHLRAQGRWPDMIETAELALTLTNDTAIQTLNHHYREKDKATNVLSFPAIDFDNDDPAFLALQSPVPLGDIVVAYETLDREKDEQDKSLKDHYTHMIIHGLLHLMGYDHIEDDEAEEMESLEIEVLSALAIENPYTNEKTVA
jgi:probable rRNA maturation factor